MADTTQLSRRERQIMDCVYARGEATVLQIQAALPDAPSGMAIRRMLSILEGKGHLKRRKEGREFVYMPSQPRKRAGVKALQHVLDTFFDGALDEALATHMEKPGTKISPRQIENMIELIERAREKGH